MINISIVDTPKILIWDVEKSYMLLRGYDMFPKHGYSLNAIEKDWIMLGAAWKWLGQVSVKSVSVSPKNPTNDYEVISILHTVLSEADVLIGHNSDAFDYKSFNARAIVHDFQPIGPKKTIDTLKLARKHFKFTSNKLAYISKLLGGEGKDESPDWPACIAGDEEALRYMRQYNRRDVLETEEVYLKLRGFHDNHPNVAPVLRDVTGETVHLCPKCASPNIISRGDRYGSKGKRLGRKYSCTDCGGWHTR